MLSESDERQLVLRRPSPDHRGDARPPRLRETLMPLILGALSTSIGIVLLIALFAGIARRPLPGWNERAVTSAAPYYVPSKNCGIAAVVAVFLGGAGGLLAWRRGRTSALSVFGIVIAMVHIFLFFAYVLVMELL